MQSAAAVLGVLRERGRRGLPLERLYRQMFNPQLYLLAYGRIYANKGAMTPGADGETADGMTLGRIGRIIDALRHERYRFRPVRRVHIPKKNGKLRPLGLPSWQDKLVGEVARLLLEAYYEPQFSCHSHGFRPRRGCHTALSEVARTWTGTTWFIEADISDCFGSFDHEVMIGALAEKIHDNRFLRLMRNMLKAGYLEDWKWGATLSGVPQGGVVSPVLSNIYLHKLDVFAGTILIPENTRGPEKRKNSEYEKVSRSLWAARRRGDWRLARDLRKRQRSLPSRDTHDPRRRRLRYIRYADDQLLGFTGPKAEAELIRDQLARFLREDLKLELSPEKTLITHARTRAARFLGYEITVRHDDRVINNKQRSLNGAITLRVPQDVIKAKCAPYLQRGKPARLTRLLNEHDYTIVSDYAAKYRGIVQYYLLAGNVARLNRLHWVMQTSLLKSLANKHRSSVSKMAAKHKTTIDTPHGPRICLEASPTRSDSRKPLVARFGGIPLRRQKTAVLTDRQPGAVVPACKELITRVLAGTCELCGTVGSIEVHQIRKLADLTTTGQPQPGWAAHMAKRRRKTLVICRSCHEAIHARQPNLPPAKNHWRAG